MDPEGEIAIMDTKLALGMARSDARRLSKSIDGKMAEFASTVFNAVSGRFRSGRRLSNEALRALVDETDRIVGTDMTPVVCLGHHRPATRTRPKGEAYERLSLHVIPKAKSSGQTFEIWAFRMMASVRRVVFDTMHTGLQFHLHTVQRVLERSDNVAEDSPVTTTAKAVLTHAGRLFAAVEAAKMRDCSLSLGIPFGPGMLAGTIERESIAPDEYMFDRTYLDAEAGLHRRLAHPFLTSGENFLRKVTLRTYIPGELMRPRQAEYTDRWEDLKYDHPVLEASATDYLWPSRELWQIEKVDGEALMKARVAVHDLVFNPEYRDDGSKRTKFYTPAPIVPELSNEIEEERVYAPLI
jgi:hypothetical protein